MNHTWPNESENTRLFYWACYKHSNEKRDKYLEGAYDNK